MGRKALNKPKRPPRQRVNKFGEAASEMKTDRCDEVFEAFEAAVTKMVRATKLTRAQIEKLAQWKRDKPSS